MKGYIHSQESFGTVDGPGIRYVLFMQGCPMRCLYCHNPDTWEIGKGQEVTAHEIIQKWKQNQSFYRNGGITVTGGEPLLQVDFLIELFKLAKKEGIHTCIDTSGITFSPTNMHPYSYTLPNYMFSNVLIQNSHVIEIKKKLEG